MWQANKIFISTLFLLISVSNNAQSTKLTPEKYHGLFSVQEQGIKEKWRVDEADTGGELIFNGLFFFYKSFISSQDNSRCNFHPSCSVYAIHSINKKGAFIGALAAFDRLIRCNGINAEDYTIYGNTGLLYDPVDRP